MFSSNLSSNRTPTKKAMPNLILDEAEDTGDEGSEAEENDDLGSLKDFIAEESENNEEETSEAEEEQCVARFFPRCFLTYSYVGLSLLPQKNGLERIKLRMDSLFSYMSFF